VHHHIFAYGSLMWRPDFEFVSARPAKLEGFHRRLCVLSHHYRGTLEKPGLVLGLDVGGECSGLVYEIAAAAWEDTTFKVRAREMLGDVYTEVVKEFSVLATDEKVQAITYVVNHQSSQYLAAQSPENLLPYINQGIGQFGACRDYVINTLLHLRQLGIYDDGLEALAAFVLPSSSNTPIG
jgi:glutathione-specific gamma-glutamylcyclotransferase